MSLSYYYRGKLILCSTNFISSIPIFKTSRFLVLAGPGPVNFWEIETDVGQVDLVQHVDKSDSVSAIFPIYFI